MFIRAPNWRWLLLIAAAIMLPQVISEPFYVRIMVLTLLYACLGQAWNIVGGYAGQLALGMGVFFGLGAYSSTLGIKLLGLSPWIGLVLGMGVSAVAAVLIGYPSFKTSGIYFAIATLGLGELARTIFLNWDFVGGSVGLEIPIMKSSLWNLQFGGSEVSYYYIIVTLFGLFYLLVRWIESSRFGYYLRTINASETAAETVGINVMRYKIYAYMLGAVLTAMCGTFYAQYLLYIDPNVLMATGTSVFVLLVAVLGGVGTPMGPLIGAAILIPLRELTRAGLGSSGSGLDGMIYSTLIVFMAVSKPGGLIQLFKQGRRKTRGEVNVQAT